MSVPFSNTTLRIPRGFGTLLEGLSREVLREQPQDIIEFAAGYFEDLLKSRTVSGIDPADWAARLEDRFYNNHAFKKKQTPIPVNEPKSAPVTIDTAQQEKGVSGQARGFERVRKICVTKPSISKETVPVMQQDEEWLSKQPGVSGSTDETISRLTEPKKDQLEEKYQVFREAAPEQGPLDDTDSKAPVEAIMEDTTSQITGADTGEGLLEGAHTQVTGGSPTASSLEMTDIQEISATSEQGQMEGTASGVIAATSEKILLEKPAYLMVVAPSEKASEEDTAPQMITTASADDQEEKIQSIDELPTDEEWLSKQPGVSGLTDETTSRLTEPKKDQLEEKYQVFREAAPEQGPLDDTDSKAPVEAIMEDTTWQKTGADTGEGLLEGAHTQVTGGTPTASSLEMTDIQEISATSEQGQMEGTASGVIAATSEKILLEKPAYLMVVAPSEKASEEDTAPQMITTASADDQEEKIQSIEELPTDEEWLSKQPGVSGLTDETISRLIEPKEDQLEEKYQVLTGAAPEQGPLDDTVSKAPGDVLMEDTTLQITGAGTEGGTNSEVVIVAQTASSLEVTDTQIFSTTSEQGQLEDTASGVIPATPETTIFKNSASSVMSAPSEAVSKEGTASHIITTASADGQEEKIQSTEELPTSTSKNEDHAAVVIQSVYRGYSTRKKLNKNASSHPETDDDLFTEACPSPCGIRNSSGEELAFSEGENINFEKALGMAGEKTKSRMGVDGLHATEINICAAELGSPLVKENINTDADICGAELQSVMKGDNKSEPDMATEMAGYDICGTELDQKDFSEAPASSTVNVDICGTELGFVIGKDAGREDNKSNQTDIKP
ncbi:uncharacterized protein spa17 [Mobula hypostoma]|uniref:uncharacterized protein spa17 n=1 Tax=Mobula hypostoma TaxID=723540 RepID=UPI002FC29E05